MDTWTDPISGVTYRVNNGQLGQPMSGAETTASEESGIGAALIGAGRTLKSWASSTPMAEFDQGEREAYQALQEQRPFSTMAGEAAPYLATAPLAGTGMLGMGANAGIGAGLSALDVEQGGTVGSRAAWGGIGSVGGDIAGRVMGRMGKALMGRRTKALPSSKYGKILEDQGYEMTPGMRTGRQELQNLDRRVLQKGGGADIYGDLVENNQARLNKQVADAIGIGVDESGEIADEALEGFGKEVNRVYKSVADALGEVDLGQEVLEELQDTGISAVTRRLPEKGTRIAGKDLEKIRQALSQRTKSPEIGDIAYAARESVEEIYEANIPEQVAREFTDIKKRYRVWKALEKGQALTAGEVNARTLATNLTRNYGRLKTRDPQIEELVQAAEGLKRYQMNAGSPTGEALKDIPAQMWESAYADRYMRGDYAPNMRALREPTGIGGAQMGAGIGRGLLAPSQDELLY